ncbi:MAG: DUF4105 domain-containing protein [Myxococcaceae bacterium]|nr:DUF4105 domain-containing protein [Myxococcaceae bacterium]
MSGLTAGALVTALVLAGPTPSPPTPSSLAARGLVLVPSSGWTSEVLEDLSLALDALPPKVRSFPGGPLELELHDELRPLGLGDEVRSTRLHLFGYRDDDDARAMAHLSRLTPDARRRLWRRRALVHAVIRRWDDARGWSADPAWRRIAGWRSDGPLLEYGWAFSRRLGRRSAALDLATFAEELLVSAESMDADAVPADDAVRCREPTKTRFLDLSLRAIDASWRPSSTCPAFERWVNARPVRGFEIIFAAPSSVASQALFGHVLLRIVRDGDEQAPGGGEALQLAALVSPVEPPTSYVWKGLGFGGGFRGVFTLTTMADLRAEALDLQQRSLRRFALELNAERRTRLLARMWELERVGYVSYRFFDGNCASMLRFLLEPVLDSAGPGAPPTPWEAPAQLLEGLSARLRPLALEPSSGEVARRADETLRQALAEQGAEAALGSRWQALLGLDGDADARVAAYRALGTPAPPALEAWRAKVALAALRRERFALDVATADRLRAEREALLPGWKGPSTDELVQSRQRRFEQATSPRMRAESELNELLTLDELLRTAPRRAPSPFERSVIDAARAAQRTFDAIADVVAELPEETLRRARTDEAEVVRRFQQDTVSRAVFESGLGHAYVAGGVHSSGAPVVRLQVAALAEDQGDQRLGGFGPQVGARALDVSADLSTGEAALRRVSVTALGVRVLAGEHLGWGASLDSVFADGAHEPAVSGEGVLALLRDARLTNFLLVSSGARVGARLGEQRAFLVAPRADVGARVQLPGSFANALRLEVGWTPRLLVQTNGARFEQAVSARVRVTVRLGVVAGVAVSLRLDGEGQWRPGVGPSGLALAGLTID